MPKKKKEGMSMFFSGGPAQVKKFGGVVSWVSENFFFGISVVFKVENLLHLVRCVEWRGDAGHPSPR